MGSRWASFAVWIAVAGSVLLWGQRLLSGSQRLPPLANSGALAASATGDLSRVLGADLAALATEPAPGVAQAPSLLLVGVIAAPVAVDRSAVALIQVDGKPARAFRPGDVVDAGVVLLEINPRGASVGPRGGPAASVLALSRPPDAVTASPAAPAVVRPSPYPPGLYSRAPTTQPDANANGGLDAAPNVLLNNPADMAPANALGSAQAAQR